MAFAKRWNGSAWVDIYPKKWNGSAWVQVDVKRWNGSAWINNESTYTKTYSCTWSQTFKDDGTQRTDNTSLYQGYYDSARGKHASLIGFDYATIKADLSNSIIDKVEIYMNNDHSYLSSGIDLYFGYHNYSSKPSTYNPSASAPYTQNFSKDEAKWFTCANSLGEGLRDGTYKGIYMFVNSTSQNYYGYFAGYGQTGSPQIRITYRK